MKFGDLLFGIRPPCAQSWILGERGGTLTNWTVSLAGVADLAFFCLFQGVLLEHREKEFGDKVSLAAVLEAVKRVKSQPSELEK